MRKYLIFIFSIFFLLQCVPAVAAPVATVGTDGTKGQAPFTVQLMGVGVDVGGDGTSMSMQWNFGDGTTSTAWNPQHTYTNAGTYTVIFTVTNSHNATDSKQITIIVTAGAPSISYKYVSATASGSGNGTQGSPWNVRQAYTLASPGDVVLFADGNYDVSNSNIQVTVSGTPNAPIIFKSQNPRGAVLDGKFLNIPISGDSVHDIVIDGFEAKNASIGGGGSRAGGAIMFLSGQNFVVKNCKVHDASQPSNAGGIKFNLVNNILIENCEIYDNYDHSYGSYLLDADPLHQSGICIMSGGEYGNPGHGVNIIIRNNLIYHEPCGVYNKNWDYGPFFVYNNQITASAKPYNLTSNNTTIHNNIFIGDPAHDRIDGISVGENIENLVPHNALIYNNTIYQSRDYGINVLNWVPDCTIYNNIICTSGSASNGALTIKSTLVNFYSDYNDLFQTPAGTIEYTSYSTLSQWRSASGKDAHSISVNPLFVNAPTDFHLQSNSPCKGTGQGSVSMGAYATGNEVIGLTGGAPALPPPSDTTPPTVSITSPSSGSTVSGTTTVSASASDNVGIAGVQFKLDGNNLGSEDTISPYSVSLNTTTLSNSSHTLTAVARDTSNNTATSNSVAINVNNSTSDTTPPTGTIQITGVEGRTDRTASKTVTLTLSANDTGSGMGSGAQMQFSNDNAIWSTAEPYRTSKSWDLTDVPSGQQQIRTVYVKFKDVAGNWSGGFSNSIILDHQPPTSPFEPSIGQ